MLIWVYKLDNEIPYLQRLFRISSISLTSTLFGDSPAAPIPRVTATEDGRYFFFMVPPQFRESDLKMVKKPHGVLYEPQVDGTNNGSVGEGNGL